MCQLQPLKHLQYGRKMSLLEITKEKEGTNHIYIHTYIAAPIILLHICMYDSANCMYACSMYTHVQHPTS